MSGYTDIHDPYLWDLLLAAGHLCNAEILSPFLSYSSLLGKGILSSVLL